MECSACPSGHCDLFLLRFVCLFLQLDEFLAKMDDPNYWRTIQDKVTGREVVLSAEQVDMIQNLQKSRFPVATTDPYEVHLYMYSVDNGVSISLPLPPYILPLQPFVDHFTHERECHPLSSTVKPKSSFMPSHWEHKKVVKLVHAIRSGWIEPHQTQTLRRPKFYLLWGESDQVNGNVDVSQESC